jgi:hypothetical protein
MQQYRYCNYDIYLLYQKDKDCLYIDVSCGDIKYTKTFTHIDFDGTIFKGNVELYYILLQDMVYRAHLGDQYTKHFNNFNDVINKGKFTIGIYFGTELIQFDLDKYEYPTLIKEKISQLEEKILKLEQKNNDLEKQNLNLEKTISQMHMLGYVNN